MHSDFRRGMGGEVATLLNDAGQYGSRRAGNDRSLFAVAQRHNICDYRGGAGRRRISGALPVTLLVRIDREGGTGNDTATGVTATDVAKSAAVVYTSGEARLILRTAH